MTTISEQYAKENALQHSLNDGYGERGYKHLDDILHVIRREGCETALDYGCGKASLARYAKRVCEVPFTNYDPAIAEFAGAPAPADLVVCTDVLEHIEPLCLTDVLRHLQELTLKAGYLQIATRPAKRILSDGRNAHLLIREPYFWLDTIRQYFDVIEFRVQPGHSMAMVVKPLGDIYK
jgi:hypothetical protein